MKKFMISASALALSGSMAFAMDEDAMDEEMMMEAPAPSVTLSAVGEFGFRNVDKDSTPNAETLELVKRYQVNFGSSSTTDGGLIFGGGISIENDHDENDGKSKVNGGNAYIGAADGTWKLKLGGNDPGIDVAGIIGVASEDGFFDGGDNAQIGLEGAFGGTAYRFTMADPKAAKDSEGDGDWSAGVRHSLGDYSVGFGLDSEGGLAFGLGATLQGVGVDMVYSKADESAFDRKNFNTSTYANRPNNGATHDAVSADADTHFVSKSIGQRILEANRNTTGTNAITNRLFAQTARIQNLGTNYGSAEWDGLGLKVTIPAGEGVKLTAAYSQREGESGMGAGNYRVVNDGTVTPVAATADNAAAVAALINPALDANTTTDGVQPPTAAQITAAQNAVVTGTQEVKKIEIGMEYVLGGGATLKAVVKKEDHETTAALTSTRPVADDSGGIVTGAAVNAETNPRSVSYVSTDSITTLELLVAFSF